MNSSAITKKALLAAALSVLLSPALIAGPRGHHTSKGTLDQNGEEQYVVVTGSHIPQKVKVKSIGTDSVHNVRIFTHEELLSTGKQTLGEAIALDPSIQLSGRH